MFKLLKWLMSSCAILLLVISLYSCGGSGTPASTGTLNIKLTDAATDRYQAVYVTINEVHVHHETGGWETLPELDLPRTVNLLELVNGVMLDLGIAELEAGHYNQMRLVLGTEPDDPAHHFANYLVFTEEGLNPAELKVPSGFQTGIKLVNGFDIVADRANELHLDFEAHRSIVEKGNGNFGLKPTIKVLETVDNTVSGTVKDEAGSAVGGAFISAQLYDQDAEDPRDEVIVESTTTTMTVDAGTDAGTYTLFLPLNTYNIVATAEGYLPQCQVLEAEWYFDNDPADFTLIEAPIETITISGTVSGLATEAEALLSIRQLDFNCIGSGYVTIEVASSLVADGGDFNIALPAGTYDLVVSAQDKLTQVVKDISGNRFLGIQF
jgi:hypothetical protein